MSAAPKDATSEAWRLWERAMGAWWDQVLESPAFYGAMGQSASAQAAGQAAWAEGTDRLLEQMRLPSREDLVRVARIASLLEDRLLQQEDQLLAIGDRLGVMEKSLAERLDRLERESLQARVEAAEARLELKESLGQTKGKR